MTELEFQIIMTLSDIKLIYCEIGLHRPSVLKQWPKSYYSSYLRVKTLCDFTSSIKLISNHSVHHSCWRCILNQCLRVQLRRIHKNHNFHMVCPRFCTLVPLSYFSSLPFFSILLYSIVNIQTKPASKDRVRC